MSKVKKDLYHPFDWFLLDKCNDASPCFKKLGFTPNHLTTLSFISGLLSCYCISIGRIYIGVVLFIISYWFDCCDGVMARKYNMSTKFGDLYDHATDTIVSVLLFYILYKRYSKCPKDFIVFCVIIGIFIVLSFYHIGCRQLVYSGDKSNESLDMYSFACSKGNPEDNLRKVKYFGSGAWILAFSICVVVFEFYSFCSKQKLERLNI